MDPFASPHKIDPQFRLLLGEASGNLCEWFARSGSDGPLPDSFLLPEVAPQLDGISNSDLLADLQLVMDGSYRPSHPGALAHLDPPPLTASIVGELICAGLNNNLLAEELSPSLSSLERQLCEWFCRKLGLKPGSGGVAASGGSLSNLMALVLARHNAGLENDSSAVFFASDDSHVSLSKAIRIMGLTQDSLQKIPTNEEGQLDINSLYSTFNRIHSENRKCFGVVATAGTTVRGAIDPINDIAKFCQKENLWLHVDGSIGGAFGLSDLTSYLIKGTSLANSITVNPQKLLGIAKASSLLLVSEKSVLSSAFSTGLPYAETPLGEYTHGGELGIQGTRSAEALKLWIGLRQLGEKGIEDLLLGSVNRRYYLESKIDTSMFEIITGPLHLLAFTPKGYSFNKGSEWSKQTRNYLLKKNFMLSRPLYKGRYYLKVVLGNPHTKNDDLELLSDFINQSIK